MKGIQKMKEGPSAGIEQANLSNHSNAAVDKAYGSEQLEKRLCRNSQIRYMKMNESEPLKKCRKRKNSAKPAFHHWAGIRIMDTCKADYPWNGIKVA